MNILLVTRDVKDGIGTTVKNLVWQFEKNPDIKKIVVVAPAEFETFSTKTSFLIAEAKGKYFFTKEPMFAYLAYKRINQALKSDHFDVIHLHSSILRFKFKKSKVISTFQGTHKALFKNVSVPVVSTFHSTKKATFKSIKLSGLKYKYGKYLHLPLMFLDTLRLKNSNLITCVSKFTLNELKEISDKKNWNKRFEYVPNGIDIDMYKPLDFNREEFVKTQYGVDISNKKVGLYIGRLESGKGVMDLANATKDIKDFILLIAGVGPERDALEKYPHIKCLGYVGDQSEKNKLINSIDVFILSSLYENFPTVIPEAMAAKKAIVSTKVGMVPEVLGFREAALVEVANIEEMKLKIERMITDTELNKQEANLNYEYAIKNLKWENVAATYLKLYNSLNN